MYLGKVVEQAVKKDLVEKPLHPYTISLFSFLQESIPEKR